MSDSPLKAVQEKWIGRVAGAAVAVVIVYGAITNPTINGVFGAVMAGLGVFILVHIVGGLFFFTLNTSLGYASEKKSPFFQGIAFIFMFGMCGLLIDFMLARGTFLVVPLTDLLFMGDISDSFWGCRDYWVSVDEGSFCNRPE